MDLRTASRMRRTNRRDSRGVAAVEAAIVLPLIMLVTFAVIEFGLIFSTESTTSSSTSAGVRSASSDVPLAADPAAAFDRVRDEVVDTLDAATGLAVPQELWIYRADTGGGPVGSPGFDACAVDCRRYTWTGSDFAYAGGTWAAPDACIVGGAGAGLATVGVYLEVRHDLISGLLFDSITIEEHSEALFEPLPSDQCS